MLKKINAVLALFSALLLTAHLLLMSPLLAGLLEFQPWFNRMGSILLRVFTLHVVLSLIIFFFCSDRSNVLQYARQNIQTIVQRATALLMLLLIHLHPHSYSSTAADGSFVPVLPNPGIFLVELLLLLSVVVHTALSLPKALVTLGLLKTERSQRGARILSCTIFGLLGLCALAALSFYCFGRFA